MFVTILQSIYLKIEVCLVKPGRLFMAVANDKTVFYIKVIYAEYLV